MKKNIFAFTLIIVLLWLGWASPVYAQTIDGYEYSVINGEATILGYQGDGGNLVIPSAFAGIPVVAISAFAFADDDTITAVTIPNTVISIGEYAFLHCTSLMSLSVGESVADISEGAFKDCTALTQIYWNAQSVHDFASTDAVFANAGIAGSGISVVFGEGVEMIPGNLFRANNAATNMVAVTIGKKVKSIGDYALPYCNCTSLVIPDKVEIIGKCAFINGKFTSVFLGKNLKEIGNSAFHCCENLTSVTIPAGVTTIGDSAFRYCSVLSQLTLDHGIAAVGDYSFCDCPALTAVTIPKSLSLIGDAAFGFYYDSDGIHQTDLMIYGYTYTETQRYAMEKGLSFVSLGGAFTDVAIDCWYDTSVNDLVARNVLCGYDNGDGTFSFQPNKKITRAEFAVILARSAGVDLTSYANTTSFLDVDASHWAASSIEWAYQHQIIYGVGQGNFMPSAHITRQDVAVMIARFAKHKKIHFPSSSDVVVFADQEDISPYAKEAVTMMQRAGIINGIISSGKTYFKATSSASRAEAAKMISYMLSL